MTPTSPPTETTSIEEHLDRLVAFEPTTLPVLSVYINTQPDSHGRDPDVSAFLRREWKRLAATWPAGSAERESFDQDTARIEAYIENELAPSANGLAIFACSGAGQFFEAIQLQAPIDQNRVYVYNQPHVFNLARIDDEFPRYAAVLTDARFGRIFVFGLGQTIETEQVKGKKMHRVKVGGWSQARYQRRVGNAHKQHAKELADALTRIVREDRVAHVVLSGDPAFVNVLREELPKDVAGLVADTLKLETRTDEQDLLAATMEKLREADARTDAEKVGRLLEQYRAGGLAVAGVEQTLEALANGQVDELLISASLEASRPEKEPVEAILAPEIPDETGGTESESPRPASVPDLLVTKARQTDAEVSFIEDPVLLAGVEGVGGFLRWR